MRKESTRAVRRAAPTLALVLAVLLAGPAGAATVTEWIVDQQASVAGSRDLLRLRGIDGVEVAREDDDSVIEFENAVQAGFGLLGTQDVLLRHRIDWLDPEQRAVSGSLSLFAWGIEDDDDFVFVDGLELDRPLSAGGPCGTTVSTYQSAEPALLQFLFSDGVMDVIVDRNRFGGSAAGPDVATIYASVLIVETVPIPLPAAAALMLGAAGVLFPFVRRRR